MAISVGALCPFGSTRLTCTAWMCFNRCSRTLRCWCVSAVNSMVTVVSISFSCFLPVLRSYCVCCTPPAPLLERAKAFVKRRGNACPRDLVASISALWQNDNRLIDRQIVYHRPLTFQGRYRGHHCGNHAIILFTSHVYLYEEGDQQLFSLVKKGPCLM